MLIIAIFAIYVIVAKRVRLTRSIEITGQNARNFGLALLVIMLPLSLVTNAILGVMLPRGLRAWPIPEALHGVIFGVVIVTIAMAFRRLPSAPAIPMPGPSSSEGETRAGLLPS